MIPGSANPLLLKSAAAAAGGYQVSRSLRFNSSDSGFCSRTPAVVGNRRTWTWAGWIKRSAISFSAEQHIWGVTGTTDDTYGEMYFGTGDTLRFGAGYYTVAGITTTRVFRDPGAWFHLVLAFDATQATAANKIRLYVNGVEETAFSSDTRSSLANQDWGYNNNVAHYIGRNPNSNIRQFNGYLAECYLIDGQQLTPSSFTEVSATTGQLIPKAYSGSFGTNGFWLKFSDNSAATAATLGKDYSGNSNNWTPNNFSVTAGAGNDSLIDTPTSFGTDTSVGGEVRGNYATWNPLGTAGPASSNGNLDIASSSTAGNKIGTILLTSGKWYWECVGDGYAGAVVGVGGEGFTGSTSSAGSKAIGYWFGGGIYWDGGSFTSGIASYTTSDVIGIAVDMTAGTVAFYKNNSLVYTATFGSGTVPNLSSGVYPGFNTGNPGGSARTVVANFGQRAFAYTAPSGFKALCDTNLPSPLIAKGNTVMDVALWTANGSSQSITGLGFQPDLVWAKSRNTGVTPHLLVDSVRGVNQVLYSHSTDSEQNYSTIGGCISAFNSDGFATGGNSDIATNNRTFVGWAWDAGTSTVSNTAGSITSQVRANASAGFSVMTGSTPASNVNFTFGHNLGIAPSLVIYKHTAVSGNWQVYHRSGSGNNYNLNSTAGPANSGTWSGLDPSSTLITIPSVIVSANSSAFVCYAFAPVVGYSSAFSYTGNGSSDGPFCFLGFRPRFIIQKRTDSAGSWLLIDTARDPVNVARNEMFANSSAAEYDNGSLLDVLSNGFKIRATFANMNASGGSFIGYAFAENPFQYARAR